MRSGSILEVSVLRAYFCSRDFALLRESFVSRLIVGALGSFRPRLNRSIHLGVMF